MNRKSIFRYELANALRSKWLYAYTTLLTIAIFSFSYLTNEVRRTELALVSVLALLVSLVSILFTTSYWYSSEKFTELLISQPVSRSRLFGARVCALGSSLTACLFISLALPCAFLGFTDWGFVWLFFSMTVSGIIFCALGALIATAIHDRMWGIGLGLGLWFYFVAIHDALTLLVLYWFRDFPLENVSALLCALNPLAILRVVLMLHFDAPLLLGHAGALLKHFAEERMYLLFPGITLFFWLMSPLAIARRKFIRRDF